MDNTKYCQSCGMPLGETSALNGTNVDESKNEDYCIYCFKDGKFIADMSMNEMIEFCVPHMVSSNPKMTEDSARKMMQEFFPQLKRWKTN